MSIGTWGVSGILLKRVQLPAPKTRPLGDPEYQAGNRLPGPFEVLQTSTRVGAALLLALGHEPAPCFASMTWQSGRTGKNDERPLTSNGRLPLEHLLCRYQVTTYYAPNVPKPPLSASPSSRCSFLSWRGSGCSPSRWPSGFVVSATIQLGWGHADTVRACDCAALKSRRTF
jgi:hypothetical protein